MSLAKLTESLQENQSLTPPQVSHAVELLLADEASLETKESFLSALTAKGETSEELTAFAREMRARSVDPQISAANLGGLLVDTCGTGGDRLGLFNISTAAALVVAAAGIPVAKHGNRAVTSACGSADVLEALGIKIDLSPAASKRSLEETHFAFFFAPLFHPAFKKLAPLRTRLAQKGQRTVFNLLGPLLNPARPNAQVIGLFSELFLDRYAQALHSLGTRHALIVHGNGMDELSTLGPNQWIELLPTGERTAATLDAQALGLPKPALNDLSGTTAKENATLLENIFNGTDTGPRFDIVLLNAAAAFVVAEKAQNLREGIPLAREQIEKGSVKGLLAKLRRFSETKKT